MVVYTLQYSAGFGKFQIFLLFYAGSAWLSDAMEMMILSLLGPAVRSLKGNESMKWTLALKEHHAGRSANVNGRIRHSHDCRQHVNGP